MGPLFKIKISLENLSSDPLTELYINYSYDPKIFRFINPVYQIPFLLPHICMPIEVQVENIDENGAAESIKILVCSKKRTTPIIGGLIPMQMSELR
jgi:hypothetical protein